MNQVRAFIFVILAMASSWAHAQYPGFMGEPAHPDNLSNNRQAGYQSFVVVPPSEVRYINNEMRFCEVAGLKHSICYARVRDYKGREKDVMVDWWRPTTYVQAITGLNNIEVTGLEPYGMHGSFVIKFQVIAP